MKKFLLLLSLLTAAAVFANPGLIKLSETVIDPAAPSVAGTASLTCAPTALGEYQFIVQPEKNFDAKELGTVNALGLKVIGHLPPNAYIMLGTKEGLEKLKLNFNILFASEYLPEYKCAALFKNKVSALGETSSEISLRLVSKESAETVKAYLTEKGGSDIVTVSQNPPILEAKVPASLVKELALRSDVLRVGPKPVCQVFNNVARSEGLMNVEPMSNLGYTGKGVTVAIADTGLDRGKTSGGDNDLHPDFQGKKIKGIVGENNVSRDTWNDIHGHGTHVAGSATGTGKNIYLGGPYTGTAPDADLYIVNIGVSRRGDVVMVSEKDFEDAFNAGARVMNNSWGGMDPDEYGAYTDYTELLDTVCNEYPDMLILFAAGNNNTKIDYANNCTISPQAVAKNVLTVGAAESYRPTVNSTWGTAFSVKDKPFKDDLVASPANDTQQGMAYFSSRGPAKDERFKPEVVAPGTYIISTESGDDETNELYYPQRGSYYTVMYGTSMATPLTSGAAAMAVQFLKEKGFENPSSALVKAALIHGARKMGNGQYDSFTEIPDDYPNSVNGYGHIDMEKSLSNGVIFVEGVISNQNDLVTYVFKKNEMGPVKLNLVWTDAPGTPGAGTELVNDLDLQFFDGLFTYFNGGQMVHNESTNNSEYYEVDDCYSGEALEIRVHGYNMMTFPQPFAFAVTGLDEGPIPEPSFALAILSMVGLFAFRKNK